MIYSNTSRKAISKIAIIGIAVVVIIAGLGTYLYYTQFSKPSLKSSLVYAYVSDFPDLDPSIAFEDAPTSVTATRS